MRKLDGKIALISGGTTGIGAETAKLFKSEGATVIVTGSSERSVETAKAAMPGVEVLVSNAADVASTKALVDLVKAKHGRIDVLFVNAGIAKFAPLELIDEAFYDNQFGVNVKGAFFLLKYAVPIIPDGGAVILTASVAGAAGGLPGATALRLNESGRALIRPYLCQGIGSARYKGQHNQPRSNRHSDPRQKWIHAKSKGIIYRRGQDSYSAGPHRHCWRLTGMSFSSPSPKLSFSGATSRTRARPNATSGT